jgi:hypothetical protein
MRRRAAPDRYSALVPKRTNLFQMVTFMIQSRLADGATVTESEELIDSATDAKREVDVCIRGQVGRQAVLVSIECRDHSRRQDVGWVEQMHGKHLSLPTSQLILVSRSGFTPQALAKARYFKIETIVPTELTDDQAGEIADRVVRVLHTKLNLQVIEVRVWLVGQEAETEEMVLTSPHDEIFNESNEVVGSMEAFVQQAIAPKVDFEKLLWEASPETRRCTVSVDPLQI